jgi:RHS repeat-associated protein
MVNADNTSSKLLRALCRLGAFALGLVLLAGASAAFGHDDAPDHTLFGPRLLQVTTSGSHEFSGAFTVPAAVGGPFTVRIVNGEANGSNRVSSATVKVNGVQIVGPGDFGPKVAAIERTLHLGAKNTYEVRVNSARGSHMTVTVLGTRLPVPTGVSPNPLTITAGGSGNLTATLAPRPASAGTLTVASANTSLAKVPASVAFTSGQQTVTIPVSGLAAGNTTITASANGTSVSASVRVNSPAPPPPVVVPPPPAQADQTLFGPKQYQRTSGAPNEYTDRFTVPASIGGPFKVRIANGAANGSNRISSATLHVNGVQIAGHADFGHNVAAIERTVTLAPKNTLELRLKGEPGSHLTITVFGSRILPAPTSLSPNPLTIAAGASGNLTATLAPPPTSAGTLSVSSANASLAAAPVSVPFAAGQQAVTIPVSGVAPGSTTITASANGGSATATVRVTAAPPTITRLAPGALGVTQGASATLTVTISSAQAHPTQVLVASSNSGVVSVPGAVTVPAGQVSASIAVSGVSRGNAQITAALNGSSATSQITVTPAPPTVVSLLPVLTNVTLGAGASLTLTISAVPITDTAVQLAATPGGIVSVPAQVVVPAGRATVTVPVDTTALGQAGVTASLNGSSASAALNVIAPPLAVTALAPDKFTMAAGTTSSFTVTINAAQTTNTTISLAASAPAVLKVPASVTIAQGATSAIFTATALAAGDTTITASANGTSQTSAVHVSPAPAAIVSLLPDPLPLQQGATGSLTVTINVAQEIPTTIALANTNTAVATVPASVVIPAGSVSTAINVSALTLGSANITASVNGTSATSKVDVTPPPPVVGTLSPVKLTLPKGTPGVLRVTLSRAPNVASAVTLTSDHPSIASVPPQVNVPAGALFADLPVMANSEGGATITASLNGGSATSAITVTPPEVVTLAISPNPASAYIGETEPFTATATMTDGTTQDFTTQVVWTSSNTTVATIVSTGVASALAAGETTITAKWTFNSAQTGQPVTITQTSVLTVKRQVALVLSAPTLSLDAGQSVVVTVTSSDPASEGPLLVALKGSGTGTGTFPQSVTVPANGTAATFTFAAATAGSVTIVASAQNREPGAITFTIGATLAISTIEPTSGAVGTTVTLTGTGFDPVPGNNALSFRGVNNTTVIAQALSTTATQMTVRVPAGADTGPITLTNSRGSAQSPTFTVTREQDFQLVVSPASLTVHQGASTAAQSQIASTGTQQLTGLVALAATGLPTGVTATFSPAATLSAFQTGVVTFAASAAAVPGKYTVTIQGSFTQGGAALMRTATANLSVAASAGVTGVKGRFVTPENQGIAGIIVRAETAQNPQPQTTTDAAGNFSIVGLGAGPLTLRFDATPANPLYPIWPYTTTLLANQILVMADFTINPPPPNERFTAIANATQEQIIKDERFPGLEIKLPAGVTITGWDGVRKNRIAVEKITPDKLPVSSPPFPMREAYQLYFGTPMGGIPSAPIPITLPNVAELEPGQQSELWFFDGSPMGGSGEWKLAGLGTISPDGKTVVSNPGVGIPRFCGVCGLLSQSCPPPPAPPPPGTCPAGNPVDLFSGQELPSTGGLRCSGLTPIETGLNYHPVDAFNNRAGTVGSFGFGWVSDYDVAFLPFDGPQKRLVMPGSRFVNFIDDGAGNYKPFDDPKFDGAVIRASNAATNQWELRFKDGRIWRFRPFAGITGNIRGGPPTFVTEMIDSAGNALSITRQPNGRINAVGSPERNVAMSYGANGFVSEVRDTANRVMRYTYTAQDRLQTVTDADGKVTRYTYVDDNEVAQDAICGAQPTAGERLKTILYPGRPAPTENFHGSSRRVLRQIGYDGREFKFAYKVTGACVTRLANPGVKCTGNCPDVDSWENFQAGWRFHGGRVIATTATQPDGTTFSHTFNVKGMPQQSTDANGQTTRFKYDASNRRVERIDALSRTWKYRYDAVGNMVQELDPLNRITDVIYDPKWNKVTSLVRHLADGTNVVSQAAYDSNTGKPIRSIDPLGNITSYAHTPRGQLSGFTVPGNRTTSFGYNTEGDLLRTTDPLGNDMLRQTDGAGRLIKYTDPLGFDTRAEYNGVDQLTKIIDPLLQETRLSYDPAQRVASVVDARNNAVESYQYDNGDRLIARVDALNKSAGNQYDSSGRLIESTDRKGQITRYGYDQKNRLTRVDFTDATQSRSYDLVGRLTEIREAGTLITYVYDGVNRIVTMTTDSAAGRHDVGYEYDNLDRLVRRTLNGADPTLYTYDVASRLASISYGNQLTSYTWDPAGRVTAKVLPNGIRQEFGYDAADRLLSIAYKKADGTSIETVSYTYDAKGQRLSKTSGGASIRETAISAMYDQANRLVSLTFPGTGETFTLTYDDNGNLVRKQGAATGATAYTWDSRNRLTQITSPTTTATFQYDALGRRISRTVNGSTTRYVYDGVQVIGEVINGQPASLLTGLRIDEVIARYTTAATSTYLTDGLGSVIAQANDQQAVQNSYAYTPYGETQPLGPDEGNAVQYTARENDQTGLYFYRARYYDPVLKRFTSEDPVGMTAGTNVNAYVKGNPASLSDPLGLIEWNGTQTSVSVGKNGYDRYILTSQCIDGWQATVTVDVLSVGAGVGAGGFWSGVTFSDPFGYVNPMVFGGLAFSGSANIALGVGVGVGAAQVGGATSYPSMSALVGRGAAAGFNVGPSSVTNIEWSQCSCP